MKNITVFAVLVIMIQCAQFAFSQEEKAASYVFSTGTKFGMFFGQTEEIVYPPLSHKAELLSQLLWDVKPVFYYGLTMDFSRAQPMTQWGFFSTFFLRSGIPGNSGDMEDRDWQSTVNADLTNYSISDNITNNLLFLDFSAGFSFPIKRILLMKTYLTVSYMHFSFSAENGYYIYAPSFGGDGTKKPLDGKVIDYTQDWLIIAPGVSLGYYFDTRFYAELSFQISPLIICNDIDQHLTRKIQFQDYMRGGLFLEPGFHFSWFAGKRLELSLDFSWRYISGTWGETYVSTIPAQYYTELGTAGAGMSMIDTGLCLKIHL